VWLDIPLNVQAASIEPSALAVFDAKVEYPDLFSLDKTLAADVQAVAQALRNARRPLLVAGHGIRLSGAIAAFRSLVEKSGVPVVVTKNAYDVLEGSHPSMMGMAGIYGQRSANFAIQSADLIVFIGSRLALTFVGYETQLFSPGSKRMVVDIDQNQLDHENVRVDKKIRQDARRFVEALEVELKGKKVMGSEEWVERCAHWKKTYPTVTEKERTQKKFINSYYFMEFLVDSLPKDAIIVHDQGAAFFCPNQSAILKKGQRMFTNGDVSPMGYGLPAAIGACVGINRKPIYCVMGDGGLQFNIQELQTIVHYKLPIKLLVLNNEGYLSIKHTQINFFKSHFVGSNSKSGLSCPDLSKISKAYGLPYVRICTNEEMRKQLPAWLAQPGAGVMEIMMDPVQPFLPKVQSERRADGTMESKPLEDMAPYVSRETLKKEMAFSSGD
jgi:acetolactate synthase-1/2/3 large subunit